MSTLEWIALPFVVGLAVASGIFYLVSYVAAILGALS